ncbi:MAG TPA: hypothetical protein VGQ96_01370 [Candidatus Eremiobacteraceae bacterium]|nr:hypothetical protein [Candidatus Eremiobacteraceae bacterium]
MTPSNAGGNGNQATVSVNVAGNVVGFCGLYGSVIPVNPVVVTWGQPLSLESRVSGNFGDNTVWVFQMTVPPGTPTSAVKGRFVVVEYQGPNTLRQMTISKSACDFRLKDYTGVNGPLGVSNGNTVSLYFGVATPFIFGDPALTAGETYYFNVRNWQLDPTPQNSCGQTSCNAVVNEQPATP